MLAKTEKISSRRLCPHGFGDSQVSCCYLRSVIRGRTADSTSGLWNFTSIATPHHLSPRPLYLSLCRFLCFNPSVQGRRPSRKVVPKSCTCECWVSVRVVNLFSDLSSKGTEHIWKTLMLVFSALILPRMDLKHFADSSGMLSKRLLPKNDFLSIQM